MMGFFGVYPQWDERNREDLYMLVVFIPTTELELVRFGAGISGTGDIMVPGTVPPEDIQAIWIIRNCMLPIFKLLADPESLSRPGHR